MAHGTSGRIVIDLDPEFKQRLYGTLRSKGMTLKEWFLGQAETLCDEYQQPALSLVAEFGTPYRIKSNNSKKA